MLENLLATAETLYDMYSMTMAYEYANRGLVDEADGDSTMFPIGEPCRPQTASSASTTGAPQGSNGDKALANSILLMRDGL